MELRLDEIESPIGTMTLVADSEALCALDFADCRARMVSLLEARYGRLRLTTATDPCGYASRLRAYLGGELDALDDIPVETGGTSFQRRVWSALRDIAPGTTVSYRQLGSSIGRPTAARAVGMATSRNPVALVVPCHRVVGADGSLTGYGGGVERKRWLLRHEGVELQSEISQNKPRRNPAIRSPTSG